MIRKKYGVIACSKCKRVWGINLLTKTTICPACGKRYMIGRRQILYTASDPKKLQQAIAQIQEYIIKR